MTGHTPVVVRVVRGVMKCIKVLGGFPYSWEDSPLPASPTLHDHAHKGAHHTYGNSANQEGYTSAGNWALKRSGLLCQQLCPRLRSVRAHLVWVAVMSLVYLVITSLSLYNFLENGIPAVKIIKNIIYFILEAVTKAVLASLLFHLIARSGGLAAIVRKLDTLPPGQSLHTWASARAACIIPLLLAFSASTWCTLRLIPQSMASQSQADRFIQIISYLGSYVLTFVILALYNSLLYLLCVMLAARVRDLRATLENMRERRGVESVRQVAGPVVCGLWHVQALLNSYFGPPMLMIVAQMILGVISNIYYIFTYRQYGIKSIVYGLSDFLNLLYLCCAPSLVHDQVREWYAFGCS